MASQVWWNGTNFKAWISGVLTTIPFGSGFTTGSILFSNGIFLTEDNTNLFWDDTNNRLGIGTNTPAQALDVIGNISASSKIFVAGLTTLDDDELTFLFNGVTRLQNNSTNAAAGMIFQGAASTSGFLTFVSTGGVGVTDFIDFRVGNNGAVRALIINTLGHVAFGGITSSFPALKRSSAELQVRLADDSADAVLQSLRISTNNAATFHTSRVGLTDGAGVALGTLATAPIAGNPTKWIGIDDNGTTRYIPAW